MKDLKTFQDCIENIFHSEAEKLNDNLSKRKEITQKRDKGFPCVHFGLNDFLETINNVVKREKLVDKDIKFLDVGSGVGQKLFFIYQLFNFTAHGIEIRQSFVKRGNELLRFFNCHESYCQITRHDALTFNNYKDYDIIYFYWPIRNIKLEIKLELKIAKTAKRGTIVIPRSPSYFDHDGNNKSLTKMGWQIRDGESRNYYYIKS